eukprot:CAMPEP_0119327044 /NCGR_PEP_ID=MMETSP1333-20130426/69799_1 /TAXON_ID=418940 /ORGANISM="Scyphosphaera apsteinii, Strain RCC1455" /LENGTH=324 /DNA_ID=CAMNT_0007335521 /DNA_START=10 /DNA_END=984 /DNA_ORIENTATION=+
MAQPPEIDTLLDDWVVAKRKKDFTLADRLRDEIRARGVEPDQARPAGSLLSDIRAYKRQETGQTAAALAGVAPGGGVAGTSASFSALAAAQGQSAAAGHQFMVPGYADPQMQVLMQPGVQTIPGSQTVLVPIEVPPGYEPQAYGEACAAAASAVTAAAFANGTGAADQSRATGAAEATTGSASSGDALLATLKSSALKLKAELGDSPTGAQCGSGVMMTPQVYNTAMEQQYVLSGAFPSPYGMAMVPPPPPPPPSKSGGKQQYDDATEARLDEWCVAKRKKDFAMADAIREELRVKGIEPDVARPAGSLLNDIGAYKRMGAGRA